MSFIFREKWIWIIIVASIAAGVVPWIVMWTILEIPDVLRPVPVWSIIVSWAVAAGYKDWVMDRRKRERLTHSID